MEVRTLINHQKRKWINLKVPLGYIKDHIIPYSICMDNSLNNIQILKKEEHNKKTGIDLKIIKEFRNKGWIEKVTNYSHELLIPIEDLKKEYIKRFEEISNEKK